MKFIHLSIVILFISCDGSSGDYREGIVSGMAPHAMVDYELTGDVVGMDQTFLNVDATSRVLNKYDAELHTFKEGYLNTYRREGLNGGRYRLNEIIADFQNGLPVTYTTTRSAGSTTTEIITYDENGRIISDVAGSFTTKYEYDGSQLVSKTVYRGDSETYRQKYEYEYDSNGNVKKSTLIFMDKDTGKPEKSSYKIYENGGVKDFYMYEDGKEELSTSYELDEKGNPVARIDEGTKDETHEYIYDDRGNWNIHVFTGSNGERYLRERVITYKDGTITGEEFIDAHKLAEKFDLTFDEDAYAKYLMTINFIRNSK